MCSCRRLSNVVNIYRRVFLILCFQLKKGKNSCSQEHFMYCGVNVAGPDQEWGVNLQGTQDISNKKLSDVWMFLIIPIAVMDVSGSYLLYLFAQSIRCLKKVIHQLDSKNKWLLLSASFAAKFELDFVLNTRKRFYLEVSF